MSKCPHPLCQVERDPGKFACKPHWYALPKQLRAMINDGTESLRVVTRAAIIFWREQLPDSEKAPRSGVSKTIIHPAEPWPFPRMR